MAGHRRTALLTGAWAVVAAAVATSAVLVPMRSHAILPGPGDLAVGWCFLAGSLLALRRPQVAACLGLGGVLWVAVGLAPLGPAAIEEPLARLALAPTALLACAADFLSAGRDRRLALLAVATAVGMAVIGGAGASRFALLGIGLAVLALPVAASGRPTSTTAVQAGVGGGLVVVGLSAAGMVTLSTGMSVAFHLFVLAAGAVAVGWSAAVGVRLGAGLTLESPLELGSALGRALGTGEVTTVFPGEDGGWLDPAGRPSEPGAAAYDVIDGAGHLLARTTPALVVEPNLVPDLHRFLRAAGDGARLRALLRERADELARSQARLVSAAEDERRRLVSRLEVGPLRRLERLAEDLGSRIDGPAWAARTAVARRTLDELVAGLDPVDAGGGLLPALARLTDASGASLLVTGAVGDVDPAAARAVWFACAEALANVRKRAPGSCATVALDASDDVVLTVTDDGPGGADPAGAGLAGLADRLALVGGSLEVNTSGAGTTLVATVPLPDDVLPLMSGRSSSRRWTHDQNNCRRRRARAPAGNRRVRLGSYPPRHDRRSCLDQVRLRGRTGRRRHRRPRRTCRRDGRPGHRHRPRRSPARGALLKSSTRWTRWRTAMPT